jgi:hypothetical protein
LRVTDVPVGFGEVPTNIVGWLEVVEVFDEVIEMVPPLPQYFGN